MASDTAQKGELNPLLAFNKDRSYCAPGCKTNPLTSGGTADHWGEIQLPAGIVSSVRSECNYKILLRDFLWPFLGMEGPTCYAGNFWSSMMSASLDSLVPNFS